MTQPEIARTGEPLAPRYARLEARLVAGVLDLVVLASFFLLFLAAALLELLLTSDFGEKDPSNAAFYTAAAILLFYLPFVIGYFVLLWTWRGQTIGQMAMHLRVVRRDGGSLGALAAALRFVGYVLGVATVFLGFLIAVLDAEKRALPDRLADTVVVELP